MGTSGNLAQRKAAIVGGSGFVGSSLTRHLSNKFDVTAFNLVPPTNFGGKFETCDIRQKDILVQKLQRFDLVINAAIVQLPR